LKKFLRRKKLLKLRERSRKLQKNNKITPLQSRKKLYKIFNMMKKFKNKPKKLTKKLSKIRMPTAFSPKTKKRL